MFCIKNILKENGAFMTIKQFKEKYEINTDYITYIGCVQAIKSYILKTGLTIDNNMSNHMIKTLKIIYSGQKCARLYYEVLIQDANKPKCCEKWETKLNTEINWNTSFKKINNKKIREIKLKWFQIRLVLRILATSVLLEYMGVENDVTCSFCGKEQNAIEHVFWEMRTCKMILETFTDSRK